MKLDCFVVLCGSVSHTHPSETIRTSPVISRDPGKNRKKSFNFFATLAISERKASGVLLVRSVVERIVVPRLIDIHQEADEKETSCNGNYGVEGVGLKEVGRGRRGRTRRGRSERADRYNRVRARLRIPDTLFLRSRLHRFKRARV